MATRGAKVTVVCPRCKDTFEARVADRNRRWGKYCSKSCKAKIQEKRTGRMANYLCSRRSYDGDEGYFSNAHQFSNEEHDCNKDY